MEIPARYIERICSVYPNLDIKALESNSDGLVNAIVIVNGKLVCRFVKEEWGRGLLAAEAKVLELVRPHVNVAIPELDHLEADFCVYRYLPGEPLTRNLLLRIGEAERGGILEQIGGFLTAMHGVPLEAVQSAGIPDSDVVRAKEDWLRLYEQVQEYLYPVFYRYQRTWTEELFAPLLSGELDPEYPPTLIHGDLAVYHFLYDPDRKRLSAVIDFGTAGLGHPATDIAALLYQYGESLTRQTGYLSLENLLPYARFWANTSELQWALSGVKNGDKGLAVAHIGSARDIGA